MGRNNNRQKNGSNRSGSSRSGGGMFRENNYSNFRDNSFSRGPREMHKATCNDCKKECQVPFKPTEGKPVFCRECYEKHKPRRF